MLMLTRKENEEQEGSGAELVPKPNIQKCVRTPFALALLWSTLPRAWQFWGNLRDSNKKLSEENRRKEGLSVKERPCHLEDTGWLGCLSRQE